MIALSLIILLLTACSKEVGDIKTASIEILEDNELTFKEQALKESDVVILNSILKDKKPYKENDKAFAMGRYRISVETDDGKINLYPYCGNLETIKIGDDGNIYLHLENDEQEEMEQVIYKYLKDVEAEGIWEWENVQ